MCDLNSFRSDCVMHRGAVISAMALSFPNCTSTYFITLHDFPFAHIALNTKSHLCLEEVTLVHQYTTNITILLSFAPK